LNSDELQEIADVFNGIKRPEYIYNWCHERAVRKKHLESLINNESDARIEDIDVSFYFDNKNGYVVRVRDEFTDYPDVIKEIIIDNIVITYSGPKPVFIRVIDK
jgi:hypothetical protein